MGYSVVRSWTTFSRGVAFFISVLRVASELPCFNVTMILSTIHRSRIAFRTLIVQGHIPAPRFRGQRRLCSRTQETAKPPANEAQPGTPAAAQPVFRVPGHKPTDFDKKILMWAGRFKTKEQIPNMVSMEMIEAARNKVRVKVCYLMIVTTIIGCLVMAISGKQAAARHESLTSWNMERKARWKQEAQQEAEAVVDRKLQ
ncbi:protein FAM162B [Brienomyrus brachyistius]|uniref:protein FAM162B n=1 Tax=Brienomyrus brachyistius TaxID=42636 RepID=UPI0020B45CE1|nr:protein FAM162B [Brienomyrus brachyistius]